MTPIRDTILIALLGLACVLLAFAYVNKPVKHFYQVADGIWVTYKPKSVVVAGR